jgi:hypothetical protein
MKITITGSMGNISKPLTKELVQKGYAGKVKLRDFAKEFASAFNSK